MSPKHRVLPIKLQCNNIHEKILKCNLFKTFNFDLIYLLKIKYSILLIRNPFVFLLFQQKNVYNNIFLNVAFE